jgi:hypothetical protein
MNRSRGFRFSVYNSYSDHFPTWPVYNSYSDHFPTWLVWDWRLWNWPGLSLDIFDLFQSHFGSSHFRPPDDLAGTTFAISIPAPFDRTSVIATSNRPIVRVLYEVGSTGNELSREPEPRSWRDKDCTHNTRLSQV